MLPDLKVDIPELEPDQVLLEQLSQLSAESVASPVSGPARTFVAAVTVVVVGGFSWLTGTLPGVASPFHRDSVDRAPQHGPAEPGPSDVQDDRSDVPAVPPVVPPGQTKAHPGRGHDGKGKSQQDNGNHTGQVQEDDATDDTQTQQDNGNHNGQTKPHQNNGNHHGQTKPEDKLGQANGNVK